KIRELRAAPDEPARALRFRKNPLGRREINAEWLLGKQVLSRAQNVAINLFMQVMRYGGINDVNFAVREQFTIILRQLPDRWQAPEPIEALLIEIADRHEFSLNGTIFQRKPSAERAGRFATHQPPANDPDANGLHCP